MREEETRTVRRTPPLRPVRPAGWWFDVLLLAGLVVITVALAAGHLFGLDRSVADWAAAHRPPVAYWTAVVFNYLGQGMPLTLITAGMGVLVAVRLRAVRAVLPTVVAFGLTYVTIGPLKVWTARPAPSASVKEPFLPPEQTLPLFQDELSLNHAQSYPSGHVANAIVWYGVLALLLTPLLRSLGRSVSPRVVTVVRLVPPIVVIVTTTYLGWHWLTDSVAGLLLGLLLDRVLHRIPWDDVPLPGPFRRYALPFLPRP